MQEEQLSLFLHRIQNQLKILVAAFHIGSIQSVQQFIQERLKSVFSAPD